MLEIFTGPSPSIRSVITEHARRSATGSTHVLGPANQSWGGLRSLLAAVLGDLGEARFLAWLNERPEAASLLLDGFSWPGADPDRVESLAAHATSHLSHNWAVQRPFFQAWGDLLASLARRHPYRLAVSDLGALDWETLAVLKTLYRGAQPPDLVLGYDPDPPEPDLDDDGLLWGLAREYVLEAFLSFRARPQVMVVQLGSCREATAPCEDWGSSRSRLPDAWETESWARRRLGDDAPLSPAEIDRIVAAQRRAFRRYGFTSTLHLGLTLLGRNPLLTAGQAAEVHGRLALAAHNRQFRSAGNRELARFIGRHLEQAYRTEPHPATRSALGYRLAVTTGRRLGDYERSEAWATRALEDSRAIEEPWAAGYLEAWAVNIRSYARARSGDRRNAVADCERGYSVLERLHHHGPPGPGAIPTARDLGSSLALMATNRSVLAWLQGDVEGFDLWRGRSRDLEWHQPGAARYEAGGWIEFQRRQNRLGAALEAALGGLESARAEHDALYQRRYLLEAADLCHRLGRLDEALDLHERERELRLRLGDPPFLPDTSLTPLASLLHAERLEEARRVISAALRRNDVENPERRAELWAARAEVEARSADGPATDLCLERAIGAAVESGARDVLVYVARQAGRCLTFLGRTDEAREAYERALELTAVGDEPPRAGDVLRIRAGLAILGVPQGGDLFALFPEALGDAESWWVLEDLRRAFPGDRPPDAPEDGWRLFLAARAERTSTGTVL